MQTSNSLGVILGLVLGKPIGVIFLSFLAIKLGWSQLPAGVSWRHMIGAGVLGGIGFTMSIFIALLAFEHTTYINQSKMAILVSSVLAAILGLMILRRAELKVGDG